ncbi:DUF1641 domain-containing protein [Streptomyces sp. NBC_01485]|uniref:DUF1641 domain-containing protein n=1 Tax=Streptomyces sp. NBC_01485 TaxID=2903884 RepID=UPI003FCEAFB6
MWCQQGKVRRQALFAEFGQAVVAGLAHQFGQFRAVGDVDRVARAVGRGRRGAPPVQVVAARAPAAAVVLADRHLEHARVVGAVDPVVRAPHRKLPADVRLGLQGLAALLDGQDVQRAARAAREARTVLEDARAVERAGLAGALVVLRDPAVRRALGVVLPEVGGEPRHMPGDALLVVLVGEVGAQGAAAVVRAAGLDALAAAAEDAVPARGQPCQIAAEDLLVVRRVRELHPCPREVEPLLVSRQGLRRQGLLGLLRGLHRLRLRRTAGGSVGFRLVRLWHSSRVSRREPVRGRSWGLWAVAFPP